MLSKTCEYALRALIYLAKHSSENKSITIKEISQSIDSPELFIAKILQQLCRDHFVQSRKGRSGGYYLLNHQLETNLSQIIIAVDGDRLFTGCGLGLHECSETSPCPIHHKYKGVREKIFMLYQSTYLKEFKENENFYVLKVLNEKNFI
ncbi:RrF2 family transcriptional regulator [Chryseobacterium sp. A301]